jgi:mono/diheme cytochrome c family protein
MCTASLATLASATNGPTTLKSASAIFGLLIPTFLGAAVLAAGGGNPEIGRRLAERWCAACHVVSPTQREASADAPPFAAIGERPGFNAEQLAYFLLEPHPKMPSMSLTRQEANDLAAYIAKAGQRP